MLIRSHALLSILVAGCLLAACSSDSGSDNASTLSGIPRPINNDGPGNPADDGTAEPDNQDSSPSGSDASPPPDEGETDEPEETTGESGSDGEPTPTPPSPEVPLPETDTPDMEVPDTETPETSEPESPETPTTDNPGASTPPTTDVNNLLGTVRFEFGFADSSDVFTLDKTFTTDGGGIDPTTGLPFIQQGAGTTIVTRCSLIPNNSMPYFCAEATAVTTNSVSFRLFHFTLESSRAGSGTFEFCPENTMPTACALDIFSTPDGQVTVSINPDSAAAIHDQDPTRQWITTDLLAHHRVSEQAQPVPADPASRPTMSDSIAAELAVELMQTTRSVLAEPTSSAPGQ